MEEIKIGKQIWMKKNLDIDTFRNGDPIPHAKTDAEWKRAGELGKPAYCNYKNAGLYGEKYGKLYNWYALEDPRGLAPKGWHVPSKKEWDDLVEYLGGVWDAGEIMKTKEGWNEKKSSGFGGKILNPNNPNGTDEVGFSALPGGQRHWTGEFMKAGEFAVWWYYSSGKSQYTHEITNYGNSIATIGTDKTNGCSVRCIRE